MWLKYIYKHWLRNLKYIEAYEGCSMSTLGIMFRVKKLLLLIASASLKSQRHFQADISSLSCVAGRCDWYLRCTLCIWLDFFHVWNCPQGLSIRKPQSRLRLKLDMNRLKKTFWKMPLVRLNQKSVGQVFKTFYSEQ